MNGKLPLLNVLMQEVDRCELCCEHDRCDLGGPESNIQSSRCLRNLIYEYPNPSPWGGIPSMYTDWGNRLYAKIAIVMKDWGLADDALALRGHCTKLANFGMSSRCAWITTVCDRPKPSPTHRNIIKYLRNSLRCYVETSAPGARPSLPKTPWLIRLTSPGSERHEEIPFLDHLYFTNTVLCFKRWGEPTSRDNIDFPESKKHCCDEREFLRRQLEIVQPCVVVAVGEAARVFAEHVQPAISGLDRISDIVKDAQESPRRYWELTYRGLSLNVIPVFHPTAYPTDRNSDEQISDYGCIWRALERILDVSGTALVSTVFPTGSITLSVAPSVAVKAGGLVAFDITISRSSGYSGEVIVHFGSSGGRPLPRDITICDVIIAPDQATGKGTIKAAPNAKGVYSATANVTCYRAFGAPQPFTVRVT